MEDFYKTISQRIIQQYGSFEEPDYSFVLQEQEANPYSHLILELSKIADDIAEDTDLNYSVSLSFVIKLRSQSYLLLLSLVGRYGVLGRISRTADLVCIVPFQDARLLTPSEKQIVDILNSHQVVILSKSELTSRVPLRISGIDSESVTIYNALFSENPITWI